MKTFGTILFALFLVCNLTIAQDTLYIYKTGSVISKRAITDIDSIAFHKNDPITNPVAATDIDGNLYHSVKIGTQVWMTENLKTTKYNDGNAIPEIADNNAWIGLTTGACCNFNNDTITCKKYGKLYNWHAVNTGKLAPTGWHVPTQVEWQLLYNYISSNVSTYGPVYKALAATTDWALTTTTDAIGNDMTKNNSSGFIALPAGNRFSGNGKFDSLGYQCEWWSTRELDSGNAIFISLLNDNTWSFTSFINKKSGFSVRCIKD